MGNTRRCHPTWCAGKCSIFSIFFQQHSSRGAPATRSTIMRIQTSAQRHPRRPGSGVARPLLADLFPCFAKGLSHSHPCSSLQFPHFVHEAQRQKVRRLRVQGREKPRHNRGKPGSGQSVVQNHPALAWDGGVVMST